MNENLMKYLGSEILIVMKINIVIFLGCDTVCEYTFFKGTYWLHLYREDAGSMFLWNMGNHLQFNWPKWFKTTPLHFLSYKGLKYKMQSKCIPC